ncbi:LamG domain-containing protein [Streptomyces sp. SID4985]|uniref:LamG domain-containing protein n=1 Tax=Streptomyces sp. SID4985 TaxID=2690292 RepID=UPI001369A5FC|nr:LamG domain-containing protein [Streptomyces sp. SID4985]MYQ47229.1 LamG domain-containing protein [Streptomyces sp. SID4985]
MGATPALADDGASSAAADSTAESRASALAAKTGERVAVDVRTTESSQVFANPDGTFTQEMNAAPVRAREDDGSWAAIDTTLVRDADGSVRARNATVDLAFSGGGSGDALVTLGDEGHKLRLGWPSALPEPRLDGSTATYAGVLPDVDLKLTAQSSGYTSVLVVKNAEAARNPALATIRMTVSGGGLDVARTADGGFVARDGDGTPVFESPAGRMWDSAGDTAATTTAGLGTQLVRTAAATGTTAEGEPEATDTTPLPAAGGEPAPSEGPGSGDATAELPLSITGTALEITPDPALLHGEDTVFPLYIDPPTKGITLGDWTALASNGTKYWEFDGDKGVGRCSNYAGYLCSNSPYTQRMYFEYPLSSIHGKKVLDATMEVYQVWTFTCDPHWYDLSRVDKGISSSTTWSSRPTGVDLMGDRYVAYGRGSLCSPSQPANWVRFSDNVDEETNENLTTTLASYATNKEAQITFSLTAHDESDAAAWARFRDDAKLSVTYISYPDKPTSYGVQQGTTGRSCNASTLPFATSDTTPKMLATVQSVDGSNAQLRALFEVWKADGSSRSWYAASPDGAWVADNAVRDASSSALPAQTNYRMRVKTQAYYKTDRGATGVLDSAWSSWCYFRIDTDSPPPPVVSSADGVYKPAETDPAAGGVGTPGRFTFTPGDTNTTTPGIQSDVVSYKWKLNSGSVSAPITVATGAATTLSITPNQAGENTVQVWGYDAAGHSSLTGYYSFLVKGAELPSGIWHLDNALTDATTATQHPLTSTGATWDTLARSGPGAAKFNGTTAYLSTSGAVLDTTKSFTVSAWARLTRKDVNYTVLSQAGTNASGFQLYYSSYSNAWLFNRHQTDTVDPVITRSFGTKPPVLNTWTHLAGVYDAANQTIQLYVNGVPQGAPVAFTTPWKASGSLQIGRLWYDGGGRENFAGTIDEVKVWSRALADTEVTHDAWLEDEDLSDGTAGDPVPALVAKWDATDMANATGTTVKDTSGFGRNLTLNGATLTQVSTGDPDIGEEVTTTQTMTLNGTSAYATATGPFVDDTGSFTATAWVTLNPAKFTDTTKSYAVQVFGQSGTSQSSWGVWYEQPAGSTQGRWTFGRPDKDGTGAVWTTNASTAFTTAQLGVPVMLTVVHDAQAAADDVDTSKLGALKLYVDSALMGDDEGVSYPAPWQGGGAFEIGRAKINGAAARYFPGSIDNVRVWAGATSTDMIANRRNAEQR